MSGKVERIKGQGDALFGGRGQLMSLWQEIAENFYPERATFTANKIIGEDFASHLETSYPILARRDLGNQIGGMLRPTNKDWFGIIKRYDDNIDLSGKAWLEWATKIQKRAMYDPIAMFTRATKEADHDWATFGQPVISVRMNMQKNALLYRNWHLKDVAWQEDAIGRIGTVYRKWKANAITLKQYFPNTCHPKVIEELSTTAGKDPYKEWNIYHCEVPANTYGEENEWGDKPLVSIYYDVKNKHIMEEVGIYESEYVIPRWQTVSGSQYAFSPATIAALPDARLIQSIARVLLDASERAVDPPMVAIKEAIRSDISVYAGGITWVDAEYDERLGEVLRELKSGASLPVGFEYNQDTREMIAECFFLNKLSLPAPTPGMTAYEAGERVGEYIRQALPLFEPMEDEYNGQLCERSFNILLRQGAFGAMRNLPTSLQGADISFRFESPMREATERVKGQKFVETKDLIAAAMEMDPAAQYVVDPVVALRDALDGTGSPASWRRDDNAVNQMVAKDAQDAAIEQEMGQIQGGADIAKTISEAIPEGAV
jgi:hypothetical protein